MNNNNKMTTLSPMTQLIYEKSDIESSVFHYDKYMYLKMYVKDNNSESQELKQKYMDYVYIHNQKLIKNPQHIDAGFDILSPCKIITNPNNVNKVDFNIVCSAVMIDNIKNLESNTGYYIYPRSSLSKTPLRLANSVGIIDSGYRGNLIGMFDLLGNEPYEVNQYDRLVQLCAPSLVPIYIEIVDTIELLGNKTLRGTNGFGSSGK